MQMLLLAMQGGRSSSHPETQNVPVVSKGMNGTTARLMTSSGCHQGQAGEKGQVHHLQYQYQPSFPSSLLSQFSEPPPPRLSSLSLLNTGSEVLLWHPLCSHCIKVGLRGGGQDRWNPALRHKGKKEAFLSPGLHTSFQVALGQIFET